MLVRDVMQPRVIAVDPHTTLSEAVRLTRQRGIRHLPVLEGRELVGIVSDRDLKRAMASAATGPEAREVTHWLVRLTVAEIMTRPVITVAPPVPVEEAARIMVREKINALPVTEEGRLVGIVTETYLLELFVNAMGAGEPSSRLDVALGERRSTLAEVVRVVEEVGMQIASIMTLVSRAGGKEAVIRVTTINPGPAVKALEARGYAVRQPWHG